MNRRRRAFERHLRRLLRRGVHQRRTFSMANDGASSPRGDGIDEGNPDLEEEEDGDDDFPSAKFLTCRGAAGVFLYDDHFAAVSSSTRIPVDIKAWVRLTALTWKQVDLEEMPPEATAASPDVDDSIVYGSVDGLSAPDGDGDDPLKLVWSKEGLVTARKDATADVSHDAPSNPTLLAGDGNADGIISQDAVASSASAGELGRTYCDADYPNASLFEKQPFSGDDNGVLVTAASSEQDDIAGDADGVHVAPASDGGLDARHKDNGILSNEATVGDHTATNRDENPANASESEGRGRFEDCCASEQTLSEDVDFANTASSYQSYLDTVVSSSDVAHHKDFRRSAPLQSGAAPAEKANFLSGEVGKIGNDTGRANQRPVKGHNARDWLERGRWDTATKTDSSLHLPLEVLRLRTKPPEGWECGPEGLCLKRSGTWKRGGGGTASATRLYEKEEGKTSV
eukprot:g12169.t1